MLLNRQFLHSKFDEALTFEAFLAASNDGQRATWDQRYGQLALSDAQRSLIAGFTRDMNVLCLTGPWCGECALQGAAMQRIAEANPARITLRFLPRFEEHADLIARSQINAGFRVPMSWFMAEDFEPVSVFGDRTLSRYRSMARKQLPEGAVVINAEPPEDPLHVVLDEMVDQFERVNLLLRTSSRLRARHGD